MLLTGHYSRRHIWKDCARKNRGSPIFRLNLLNQWISECTSKHAHCTKNFRRHPPELPTRVLEISMGKGGEPFDIRLHVTKDSARAHYVALSHCWGDIIPPRTLKANLRRHLRLIAILPCLQRFKMRFYTLIGRNVGTSGSTHCAFCRTIRTTGRPKLRTCHLSTLMPCSQ